MHNAIYTAAFNNAVKQARLYSRPMGLERAIEYGVEVFNVKMIPKDPAKRFGFETRVQVVEPSETLMEVRA